LAWGVACPVSWAGDYRLLQAALQYGAAIGPIRGDADPAAKDRLSRGEGRGAFTELKTIAKAGVQVWF